MPYESCCEKYGHYFSPRLKEIFREYGKPIPWILELVDEDCEDVTCRHHVFYEAVGGDGGNQKSFMSVTSDEPCVKQCHRCMCLLELVEGGISQEDISRAYGVTRNAIQYYENMALKKVKARMLKKAIRDTWFLDVL